MMRIVILAPNLSAEGSLAGWVTTPFKSVWCEDITNVSMEFAWRRDKVTYNFDCGDVYIFEADFGQDTLDEIIALKSTEICQEVNKGY